jgi:hypothetical protein
MANSLITNLTDRATLDGTEEIPLNLPGTPDVDRKATIAAVKTYAQADLGTAAFADTGDFATAAQGALADTAVQPADIGTAAAEDVGYFATAAQGTKADTALQPAEVKSSNFTAANDGLYVVVASATVTDPSPSEGKGFTVVVRNGTATIGGTGYSTAGSQIRRLFHSGAWATYVDVLTTDSRLTDARTPTAHASSHVTAGSDKIRDASASQDGLMTTAYASKLDGIEAAADVTDAGNVGSSIHGATAKTTPVDADTMPLIDSAASNVLKKVTWANIKATLQTAYDALYSKVGSVSSSGLTMTTARLLGRTTASTGAIEELTATAATAFLNAMVGDSGSGGTKGLVPAPAAGDAAGGKYLKADGSWATVSAGSTAWSSVTGKPTTKCLTSDVTSNSTSLADVTGLPVTISATGTYKFEWVGAFTSNTTTEGLTIAMNGPSSSFIYFSVAVALSTNYVNGYTVYSSWDTGSVVATTGGATAREFRVTGVFTATSTGTIAPRFSAESGGGNSVSIKGGSWFTVTPAD